MLRRITNCENNFVVGMTLYTVNSMLANRILYLKRSPDMGTDGLGWGCVKKSKVVAVLMHLMKS